MVVSALAIVTGIGVAVWVLKKGRAQNLIVEAENAKNRNDPGPSK